MAPFITWARLNLFRARFLRFALLGALLALVACKTSDLTDSLRLVIAAAEAAVGTLGATGSISQATVTDLNGYLGSVSQFVSFAATELASADTSAQKALKIGDKAAGIAALNLPAGTPQTVVTVMQAVLIAVQNFLSTAGVQATGGLRAAAVTGPLPEIKLTRGDHAALAKIKSRADALRTRIK